MNMFYQQPSKETILYIHPKQPDKLFLYLYPYQSWEMRPNMPLMIVCEDITDKRNKGPFGQRIYNTQSHNVFHPESLINVTKEWIIIDYEEDKIEI